MRREIDDRQKILESKDRVCHDVANAVEGRFALDYLDVYRVLSAI